MNNNRTYLSIGDFIDLYFKIEQKGHQVLVRKFNFSKKKKIISKWNQTEESSDFWIIPAIRERWNEKCTGDLKKNYEHYIFERYLQTKNNLTMLSVGCGTGSKERAFAQFPCFSYITGIDLADHTIEHARKEAKKNQFNQINYINDDFCQHQFDEKFDLILFNSSLHHFEEIHSIIEQNVIPILKTDGLLVIFEFVGPNRLQWKREQLKFANQTLQQIPKTFRKRINGRSIKNKIYRPGWLRMKLNDPSEAIDSESILPAIHQKMRIIEEKKIGWDITHLVFKDIAHNFVSKEVETQKWVKFLIDKEDEYLKNTGRSDAIFGIYQKPDQNLLV